MLKNIVMVALSLVIIGAAGYWLEANFSISPKKHAASNQLVGGGADSHGCSTDGGYQWCALKNKCIRTWEESCDLSSPTLTPTPTASDYADLIAAVKAGLIAEHGQSAASLQITVSKINGNYAQGAANEEHGGGMWFAAQVNGTWKLVWDGNGIINCTSLASYSAFPKDMIPQCWDDTIGDMRKR